MQKVRDYNTDFRLPNLSFMQKLRLTCGNTPTYPHKSLYMTFMCKINKKLQLENKIAGKTLAAGQTALHRPGLAQP